MAGEPSTDYRAVSTALLNVATSQCPSKPSQALRFKQLDGFRIHRERDGLQDSNRKGRHLKIQSDTSGSLRISKKSYTAPKVCERNQTFKSNPTMLVPSGFNPMVIPDTIDRLPDCVDLSILNDGPRPRLSSDYPLLSWVEHD
ncbi:hypothetical protein JVT61DRAFT_3419 [Boletus reticuloceps]|uniref:Uncharacterized protein n=1 Tax=Boletus reticuloceps TaxID=495285 RepID=A0A8I2YNZ2_9AGAM|nr:hypothetical protein JVT61DRAFT_3419 [Boletus reticuloceps]